MGGYTGKIRESNKTREEVGFRKPDPTQESGARKFQDDDCAIHWCRKMGNP